MILTRSRSIVFRFRELIERTTAAVRYLNDQVNQSRIGGSDLPKKPRSHGLNSVSIVSVVKEELDKKFFATGEAVEEDEERPVEKPCSLLEKLKSRGASFATRCLVNVVTELKMTAVLDQPIW